MENKKIAIASDHAGYRIKTIVKNFLHSKGYPVDDLGTYTEERTDYPDYAHKIAESMLTGDYLFGFTVCGSGNGINMAANKHSHIRSALCWNPEIAALARQHNDANICALPGRFIDEESAINITIAFLKSTFEGGRHQPRVNKIPIQK